MTGTKTWRLWVEIKVEPEDHGREYVLDAPGHSGRDEEGNPAGSYHVYDSSGAQGTYIEIENTGDVLRFPSDFVVWVNESTQRAQRMANGVLSDATEVRQGFTLTHTDGERPVVLLAAAGGNQIFDHWETPAPSDTWVVSSQGARSEWPEPPPDTDPTAEFDKYVGLYARAVFRKTATWTAPFTPGQESHRPQTPQPEPSTHGYPFPQTER